MVYNLFSSRKLIKSSRLNSILAQKIVTTYEIVLFGRHSQLYGMNAENNAHNSFSAIKQ